MAAILKNCKRPYLHNGLTDLHKIRQDDAFWPSEGYRQLKFPTFKIQDGGRPPSWKTENVVSMDITNSLLKTGNKTANINVKNRSLYTLLTMTDRKQQKS